MSRKWRSEEEITKRERAAKTGIIQCLASPEIDATGRRQFSLKVLERIGAIAEVAMNRSGMTMYTVYRHVLILSWRWRYDKIMLSFIVKTHGDRTKLISSRGHDDVSVYKLSRLIRKPTLVTSDIESVMRYKATPSKFVEAIKDYDEESQNAISRWQSRYQKRVLKKYAPFNDSPIPALGTLAREYSEKSPILSIRPIVLFEEYDLAAFHVRFAATGMNLIATKFGWFPESSNNRWTLTEKMPVLQLLEAFGFKIIMSKDIIDSIVMNAILNVS